MHFFVLSLGLHLHKEMEKEGIEERKACLRAAAGAGFRCRVAPSLRWCSIPGTHWLPVLAGVWRKSHSCKLHSQQNSTASPICALCFTAPAGFIPSKQLLTSPIRGVSQIIVSGLFCSYSWHHLSLFQLLIHSVLSPFFETLDLATTALKCSHFILFGSHDFHS